VGAQRIRASVNVDYDTSSSEENQETYDPKSAVAVTMQTSEEKTFRRESAAGYREPRATFPPRPLLPRQKRKATIRFNPRRHRMPLYAVDKVVRHTLQPMGRIGESRRIAG